MVHRCVPYGRPNYYFRGLMIYGLVALSISTEANFIQKSYVFVIFRFYALFRAHFEPKGQFHKKSVILWNMRISSEIVKMCLLGIVKLLFCHASPPSPWFWWLVFSLFDNLGKKTKGSCLIFIKNWKSITPSSSNLRFWCYT